MNKYSTDEIPVSIEAEEAILGGILLDSKAMTRIADTIKPEHFSLMAHQVIYETALQLHRKNEIVDLMSVTHKLAASKELIGIGGQTKLAQLINRTVSAVNIDRYALLLVDKYRRRKLIEIGYTLVSLGKDQHLELEELETLAKSSFEEWLDPNLETSQITEPIEINYQHSITQISKNSNEDANAENTTVTESITLKTITNSVSKINELVTELKQKTKDCLKE